MFYTLMNPANHRDTRPAAKAGRRFKILLALCLSLPILGLLGLSPANASGPVGQPTLPAAPLAPSTPTAVHNGSTQVTLTWTDRSTNELVFGVQYRDHGGAWKNAPSLPSTSISTTGKTYTITHAVPYGTIFCYHISAANLGGVKYSPEACAVPAAPSRPTNLRVTLIGANSVGLSFGRSVVWEWGYGLYTKRAGDSSWVLNKVLVSRPPSSATEQMLADNLIWGQDYCFRVVAMNSRGQSLPSNEVCATPDYVME
ncbi:hypothetical protein AU252_20265 [Pseudarthrobacter sulfonivorans]|uniref:Fibronectin type-III domain-containing protein n=2 Tax=Pseudarthrobacter sulfonivorans TaxID=121292 RepID=A0A0U3QU63_9MICC|nr:hypothetical protein AU252_20265 [Pseudarthrobacter sulfonivorans]